MRASRAFNVCYRPMERRKEAFFHRCLLPRWRFHYAAAMVDSFLAISRLILLYLARAIAMWVSWCSSAEYWLPWSSSTKASQGVQTTAAAMDRYCRCYWEWAQLFKRWRDSRGCKVQGRSSAEERHRGKEEKQVLLSCRRACLGSLLMRSELVSLLMKSEWVDDWVCLFQDAQLFSLVRHGCAIFITFMNIIILLSSVPLIDIARDSWMAELEQHPCNPDKVVGQLGKAMQPAQAVHSLILRSEVPSILCSGSKIRASSHATTWQPVVSARYSTLVWWR